MPSPSIRESYRFVEAAAFCRGEAALADLLAAHLREIGFESFLYVPYAGLRMITQEPMIISRYPAEWLRHYHDCRYYREDAVSQAAVTRALPFCWDDIRRHGALTPVQKRIFDEAAEAGLRSGYTVPVPTGSRLPAALNLASEKDDLPPDAIHGAHIMALHFHDAVQDIRGNAEDDELSVPHEPLGKTESRVLELCAEGKDIGAIAEMTGFDERRVHRCLEAAKAKMSAESLAQTVIRAILAGEIRPS